MGRAPKDNPNWLRPVKIVFRNQYEERTFLAKLNEAKLSDTAEWKNQWGKMKFRPSFTSEKREKLRKLRSEVKELNDANENKENMSYTVRSDTCSVARYLRKEGEEDSFWIVDRNFTFQPKKPAGTPPENQGEV